MAENSRDFFHEIDKTIKGFDIYFWTFNDTSRYVSTHWHTAVELIYIIAGGMDVVIQDKTASLLPGDLYIINSAVPHSTKSPNGNIAVVIQLPYSLLQKHIPDIDGLTFDYDYRCQNRDFLRKKKELVDTILGMREIFDRGIPEERLLFNSLIFQLMYRLKTSFAKELPADATHKEAKTFKRVEEILDYLNANYNRQISLSEIASVACFSEEYFCRFFKKNMGMTYTRYLNELRLTRIRDDLINTELPLKTLLEIHGFSNYKLFRKMFNEEFGMTPMQYRIYFT